MTQEAGQLLDASISRRRFLRSQVVSAAVAFLPAPLLRVALHAQGAKPPLGLTNILCAGTYPGHLQGICTDNRSSVYWVFTKVLVKTDTSGAVQKQIPVVSHHGSPCYTDGKVYVPVNLGKFNNSAQHADSWIYVYDANDLTLLKKQKASEVIYGAGGMAYHDRKFLVVGGLPKGEGFDENLLYEYDRDLNFIRQIRLKSGYTLMGIQTAAFNDGYWWFGCYGKPPVLLKVDKHFNSIHKYEVDCAIGIASIAKHTFLIARGNTNCYKDGGCTGQLFPAVVDPERGLVLRGGEAPIS